MNQLKRKSKINKNEKGQSLVELAVSLVILLWLISFVVDIGRIAFNYLSMRDAAQEGASYGSIIPFDNKEIISRVKEGLVDKNKEGIEVIINIYDCEYISDKKICEDIKYTCSSVTDVDSCSNIRYYANDYVVNDNMIEIIVIDEKFKITMPFSNLFFTTNNNMEITLKANIKDNIIRVPVPKSSINEITEVNYVYRER